MLAIPASALAVTGAVSDSQAAQNLQAQVTPRRLTVNHQVTVSGTAPSADAGRRATLETTYGPSGHWRSLVTGRISRSGAFRIRTLLRHSGYLRVVTAQPLASTASVSPEANGAQASNALPVAVHAHFRVRPHTVPVLAGRPTLYGGRLIPARAGRRVSLQAHTAHGWKTLGAARTGRRGGFRIRTGATGGQNRRLRIVFAGDRANARSIQPAGRTEEFTAEMASWYNDAGNTACGYHAGLGVANRTLPCGTKVRFYYGGRTVTATVDDRGPFVGGRDWDLNQNTAAALGFGGVGTVYVAH
jgi:hypothetical protein